MSLDWDFIRSRADLGFLSPKLQVGAIWRGLGCLSLEISFFFYTYGALHTQRAVMNVRLNNMYFCLKEEIGCPKLEAGRMSADRP